MTKIKKILGIAALITGFLLLLLCFLFVLIQTKYGKEKIVGVINSSLAEKGDIQIMVRGLSGTIPFHMKMDKLSLSDNSGIWLEINNLSIRLSLLELLKKRLFIRELIIDTIDLGRLPYSGNSKEKGQETFSWPVSLYRISVRKLEIGEISLKEDLLGESAKFNVLASIIDNPSDYISDINIKIERTDGITGLIFFNASLKGTTPYITADAGIVESGNGVVGRLLGTGGPVNIKMSGSGFADDWNGTLMARIDRIGDLDAEIGLQFLKEVSIRANGSFKPVTGFVPESITQWISQGVNFMLETRSIKDRILPMELFKLKTENAGLDFSGVLNLNDMSTKGRFTFNLNDLSPIEQSIKKRCAGSLIMEGDLEGTIFKPIADLAFEVTSLKIDNFLTDNFSGELHAEFEDTRDLLSSSFSISGVGQIRDLSITTGSRHYSEKLLTWDLDLERAGDDLIRVTKLETSANDLSLKISGDLNYHEKRMNLEGVLGLKSLERLSTLLKYDIPGSASLNVKVDADGLRRFLTADMSGKLRIPSNEDFPFVFLVGQEINYAGSIQLDEKSNLKFSGLQIHSDNIKLGGTGSCNLDRREIDTSLNLDIPSIAPLSTIIKQDVTGNARIDLRLKGDPNTIQLKCDADIKEPSILDISFNSFLVSIYTAGLPENNKGNITMTMERPDYKITAISDYSIKWPVFSLNKILVNGPVSRVDGDLSFDTSKNLADGELRLECTDLSVPSSIIGEKIEGSATVKTKIESGVKDNMVNLELHSQELMGRFGRLTALDAKIKMADIFRLPELEAELSIADFEIKDISMDAIDIKSQGNIKHATFSAAGYGKAGEELELESSGEFSIYDDEKNLRIELLSGRYGSIPMELIKPFNVRYRSREAILEEILLGLGKGSLVCTGNISKDSILLSLNIKKLPLDFLSMTGLPRLQGEASADLITRGSPDMPEITLYLNIDELKLPAFRGEEIPALSLMFQSSLKSGRFMADLAMKGLTGNPFKANIELPMMLTLKPFSFLIPRDGALTGGIEGDIILENIASVAELEDQLLSGEIGVAFDISGNIAAPIIKGKAVMQNGEYEHLRIGTVFKNIDMEVLSDTNRINIDRLNADDGSGGTISARGWVDIIPEEDFPFNMDVAVNSFTLINNDTASAKVNGTSSMSGSVKTQNLKGELIIESAEFNIPERLPTEITDLDVIEINSPEPLTIVEPEINAKKSSINLDLSVVSTGRTFFNGRGLMSEWKGDVLIKGSTSEPLITGRLSVLRGSYNFLGKRFSLNKGSITFNGEYPPLPTLDLTGEAVSNDMTAIVNLSGTVQDVDLNLSSEPLLPQDEILSRLLFGRSVSQVTPVQAIQLGNAVNSLRGGSSFDLMGRARRFLGFDQLEVRQSGENINESAISAGKYLGDKVYLEVEKGIGAESGKASLKYELSPNINVETEVGENAETGVGINWKLDF